MARKKKHPEHVNHERWLVSYADFITLLFAFFTSMYAISTVDAKKAGKMVFSTRAAFNLDFFPQEKPVLGGSQTQAAAPLDDQLPSKEKIVKDMPKPRLPGAAPSVPGGRALAVVARDLRRYVDANSLGDKINVRLEKQGLVVSLAEAAFFGPGEAKVKSSSLGTLETVAKLLVGTRQAIRVEGHTDGTPVAGSRARSNWELSAGRSLSVLTYFVEEFGYSANLLSLAGYSSYRPVASNDTPAGRAQNRRVDLVVVPAPDELLPLPATLEQRAVPRKDAKPKSP